MVADDPESFADIDGHGPNPDCDAAGNCRLKIPTWQQFQNNLRQFFEDLPGNFNAMYWGGGSKVAGDMLKPVNQLLNDVGVDTGAVGHAIDNADTDATSKAEEAGKILWSAVAIFAGGGESKAVKAEQKGETFLYQKLAADGTHLKFGITNNPATRYSEKELAGGRLKILARGSRKDMLRLERSLHSTLPLGPEERQIIYRILQASKGLSTPGN